MNLRVCKPVRRWPIPKSDIPALALAYLGVACSATSSRPAPGGLVPEHGVPVVVAKNSVTSTLTGLGPGEGSGETSSAKTSSGFPVHGSLSSTYRARWTGDEDDHDLTEALSLDFGDPARHAWTGHAMTRINADLDGREGSPSAFSDLNDTYDGAVTARLYDAWAERRGQGFLERTRFGRQSLWDTPAFAWFDGVSAQTRESERVAASLGAYGGIPVHMFESSRSGDLLLGLYAQARPWTGGRLRVDWMHLEEEDQSGDHQGELWKLGVWQGLSEEVQVEGSASMLGSEERDWSATASWRRPEAGLTLQASYYELLTTQSDVPSEIDPFIASLGELFPFRQARLVASKDLGKKVSVDVGADVRRVAEDNDEGAFNRDFERLFSTVHVRDVLPAGLALGVTGETWNSGGSDIRTWGVDLSRRFGETFDTSLGSLYALYKVDATTGEEREDVRTWYLRLGWKRTPATRWDLRYDIEDSDIDTFQGLRLGLTWRF